MTTQSSLQYSFRFTQSHTHSYSASISSTLLFYEAQFGVQHLAQGHFGMQIFWEDWGSNCRPSGLEGDHSTPSATAATKKRKLVCRWGFVLIFWSADDRESDISSMNPWSQRASCQQSTPPLLLVWWCGGGGVIWHILSHQLVLGETFVHDAFSCSQSIRACLSVWHVCQQPGAHTELTELYKHGLMINSSH